VRIHSAALLTAICLALALSVSAEPEPGVQHALVFENDMMGHPSSDKNTTGEG